jgi:hypothetical protein
MTGHMLTQFKELEPFVESWSLATENQRRAKRKSSTTAELKQFYDAMLPRLEEILDLADKYPKGQMPPEVERYFFMALSLAEVAPHVELYKGNPNVPYSFTEERFVAVHGEERG